MKMDRHELTGTPSFVDREDEIADEGRLGSWSDICNNRPALVVQARANPFFATYTTFFASDRQTIILFACGQT